MRELPLTLRKERLLATSLLLSSPPSSTTLHNQLHHRPLHPPVATYVRSLHQTANGNEKKTLATILPPPSSVVTKRNANISLPPSSTHRRQSRSPADPAPFHRLAQSSTNRTDYIEPTTSSSNTPAPPHTAAQNIPRQFLKRGAAALQTPLRSLRVSPLTMPSPSTNNSLFHHLPPHSEQRAQPDVQTIRFVTDRTAGRRPTLASHTAGTQLSSTRASVIQQPLRGHLFPTWV